MRISAFNLRWWGMACLLWLGFVHQGLAQSDWSDLLTPYGRILDLNGRNIVELPPQEMTEDVEILLLGNNQLRNLPLDLARRCPHVKAIFLSNGNKLVGCRIFQKPTIWPARQKFVADDAQIL